MLPAAWALASTLGVTIDDALALVARARSRARADDARLGLLLAAGGSADRTGESGL